MQLSDSDIEGVFKQRSTWATDSLGAVHPDDDPERAARAVSLSETTGASAESILPNLDDFEHQHRLILSSDLVANNPHLQKYLNSDAMAPKISHDDIANLDVASQALDAFSTRHKPFGQEFINWLKSDTIAKGVAKGFGDQPLGSMFIHDGFAPTGNPALDTLNRFTEATARAASSVPELGLRGLNAAIYGTTSGLFGPEEGEKLAQFLLDPGLQATLSGFGPPGAVVGGFQHAMSLTSAWIKAGRSVPTGVHPVIDAFKVEDAKQDAKLLDDAVKASQASATRERSPQYYANFAEGPSGGAKIAIDANAIARLYGEKVPEVDDGLLGWIPNLQDRLAATAGSGGYIEVPVKDYVSRIDPELHKEIKDDILFRSNGFTINETKELPTPSSEEVPRTIDEAHSVVRGAAYLEPLFSVGDRKVTLQRMAQAGKEPSQFGPEQGFHDFDILDHEGKRIGALNLSEQKDGRQLYVDMIQAGADARMYDPNFLGPSLVRDLFRQIKAEFPRAFGPEGLGLTGHRVSGAREKAGVEMTAPMPVVKRLDNSDHINSFRQLLNELVGGGERRAELYPGINAWLKPPEDWLPHEHEIAQAIQEEFSKIAPKSTSRVVGAIEEARAGQTNAMVLPDLKQAGKDLTVFSLMSKDPIGDVHHEAIHALRRGFFTHDEWQTLKSAALEQNWHGKYNIGRTYGDRHPEIQVEESIAEAFRDWMKNREMVVKPEVHGLFEKLKAFFERLRERIGEILGRDFTWEELFEKTAEGEVGAREQRGDIAGTTFRREAEPLAAREANDNKTLKRRRQERMDYLVQEMDKINNRKEVNEFESSRFWKLRAELLKLERDETAEPLRSAEPPPLPSSMEEKVGLPFGDHRAIGIPKAMYDRYLRLIQRRHDADIRADFEAFYDKERRTQTKEWKENRTALREQVESEINDKPDIVVDRLFSERGGDLKIDPMSIREDLREALPKDYMRRVNSISADELAGHFGYPSGDALVQSLAELAQDRKAKGLSHDAYVRGLIDSETDRRMEAQYGWLEKNILEEAKDRALANNQFDILHEETVFLAQKAGVAPPLPKAAMQAALRDGFDSTPVGEISSDTWLKAAGKAGRKTEEALMKDDIQEAFKQKQVQFNAATQAKWAREYEKERGKFDKLAKRYRRPPTKETAKKIETVYYDYIQQLLQRTGNKVRRDPQAIIESVEKGGYDSFRDFVESELHQLSELKVADWLMDERLQKETDSLPYREFKDLSNAIETMNHVGRDKKKILLEGEKADLDDIMDRIIDQLSFLPAKEHRIDRPPNFIKDTATAAWWAHVSTETMWNRLDRGDRKGLLNRLLSYPAAQAGNYKAKLLRDFSDEIAKIGRIPDMDKMVENNLWIDPQTGSPFRMRKRNVLGIIQNWGNASNRRKLLEGYGVDEAAAADWLKKNSTPEDWARAQQIGDIYKRIHAMADNMSYNVSGVGIDPLPIEQFTSPHGEALDGWYNPVKYDPIRPGKSRKLLGANTLESEGYFRATTPTGYTKARTEYIAPVELNLDIVPIRMKQMLHDIAMRPAINQLSKLIYDHRFQNAVISRYGKFQMDEMKSYLKDIANSSNFLSDTQHLGNTAVELIRQNTISTLIGWNPGTVMKHGPTAFINSLTEVGPANFLREALTSMVTDPTTGHRNWEMARTKSEEIQRRMKNWEEVIRTRDREISFDPKTSSQWRDTMMYLGQFPVAFSDYISTVPVWLAEYKKQIAEGADEGMAITLADRAVRKAHGSSAITARPGVSRSENALVQTYASLYGFFSHMLQKQYELSWMARDMLQGNKPAEVTGKMDFAKTMMTGIMSYVIAPAIIEELVTPYTNSEKDSWGKKAALAMTMGVSSSFVMIRDLVRSAINARDPQLGTMPVSVKGVTDVFRDLAKNKPFSREHAGKLIKDAFTVTGIATGLVNAQTGRMAAYMHRYATGLERPHGPWDVATGLRYGTTEKHSHTFAEWWHHTIGGKH